MRILYIVIICLFPWIIGTSILMGYYHGIEFMLDGVVLGFIAGLVALGPTACIFEPLYEWITRHETLESTSRIS